MTRAAVMNLGLVPYEEAWELQRAVAAEVAERTVELDMLAIETIVEGVGNRFGARYLSVNVSPRSLETDFPVATLVTLLHRHGLEPDRIVLELTERGVARTFQQALGRGRGGALGRHPCGRRPSAPARILPARP